jgi:alcohol dehydrogenase (cytochrome c)
MATEYVDAGTAVPYAALSTSVGKAPPVTKGVTYDRILNARDEPHNWLTYYGAYDANRYSPLDQINASNVGQLTPQWVFQAGNVGLRSGATTYAWEASPIVVDGVMFVSGWDGQLWALDATNGQELWRYRHASPFDVSLCCGNVNRGVAVAEGNVFMTTLNAHVIALDAETGKKIWDKPFGDVRAGESATVAPLVVKDLVIVGSSGGEFGVRGHTDAFNRETGEHVWCRSPGSPGPRPGPPTARPGRAAARTAGSRPATTRT